MTVRVTSSHFDAGAELARFEAAQSAAVGAVVSFLGRVRDHDAAGKIHGLTLEHYPGMVERELERIVEDARTRWALADVLVIHRHGDLAPGAPIVFVATAASHRAAAFDAAAYLMDYLKTRAPFWKKEVRESGAGWVEARGQDDAAAARWTSDIK